MTSNYFSEKLWQFTGVDNSCSTQMIDKVKKCDFLRTDLIPDLYKILHLFPVDFYPINSLHKKETPLDVKKRMLNYHLQLTNFIKSINWIGVSTNSERFVSELFKSKLRIEKYFLSYLNVYGYDKDIYNCLHKNKSHEN